MNIVCVPGLWLGGWSWTDVAVVLRRAGHRVATPTLPGLDSPEDPRGGITLATHVQIIASIVKRWSSPVAVIGHGHAARIAWSVAAQHPDLISPLVLVDPAPVTEADRNSFLVSVDGIEIPVPSWEELAAARPAWTKDIDRAIWDRWRSRAVPQPVGTLGTDSALAAAVDCEALVLDGTGVGGAWPEATVIELAGGHWPQLTRPQELAALLLNILPPPRQ